MYSLPERRIFQLREEFRPHAARVPIIRHLPDGDEVLRQWRATARETGNRLEHPLLLLTINRTILELKLVKSFDYGHLASLLIEPFWN